MAWRHPGTDLPIVLIKLVEVFVQSGGIIIHYNTLVYINRNEVELRLGTNTAIHPRSITLTVSQIDIKYTYGNPHPSWALWCQSP
jgi:hypothetical protein